MMVFDRRHCRWLPWHGTRAAWLKLPHAAATGVCLLGAVALRTATSSAALPAQPAKVDDAPVPAPSATLVMAVFPSGALLNRPGALLNQPSTAGIGTSAVTPAVVPMFVQLPPGFGPSPSTGSGGGIDGGSPPPIPTGGTGSSTPAPEPGSVALLLGALGLLAALRGSASKRRAG